MSHQDLIVEAERYRSLSDRVKSSELFTRAFEAQPDDPYALRMAAEMSLRAGFGAQAERLCRANLARFPDDAFIRSILLESLLYLNRGEDAVELAKEFTRQFPHFTVGVAVLARQRAAQGDVVGALKLLQDEIAAGYGDFFIFNELYGLYGAGKLSAEAVLEPLLRYGPTSSDPELALLIQSQVYISIKKLDEAEVAIERAERLSPKSDGVLRVRAQLAQAQKDWPRMLELCEAYLAMAPGDEDFFLMKAFALVRLKRRKEAIQILETAIGANPESVQVRWTLVLAYLESFRLMAALRQTMSIRRLNLGRPSP